jgi:FKBP-type peptidyl-prolyl cis-trans isomerase FkpA
MKKIIAAALAASLFAFSCASYKGPSESSLTEPSKADASYAFGVAVGGSLKGTNVELDYQVFLQGIKDEVESGKTKLTMDEANQIIQVAISAAMAKAAEANVAKEAEFLAANAKKSGMQSTASGLQYEVLTQGTGPKPQASDVVKVEYEGSFLDGEVFDSSAMHGEPAVFPLDQVITGWTEGIQLMPVGSKYKFYIPSALAYGPEGAGGVIPPSSTLIFVVELLSIETGQF